MSVGNWLLMFQRNSAFQISGTDYLGMQHHIPGDKHTYLHCHENLRLAPLIRRLGGPPELAWTLWKREESMHLP
jgi:hypothetical protein